MYPKKKKNPVILSTHLYSNVWFLSIFVIYSNSNTSIIFIIIIKIKINKKTSLPHVKLFILIPNFFFKFFKTFQNLFFIQILYSYHKSSSICTSIYHLSFVQISNFFYLLQFLSQSINSNVPLGFNFLQFSISFLNIILYYLTSSFKY